MSTYSAVANSEIAVGAPITNSLKTKERDNLLAIQENDASAPTVAYATSAGTVGSNSVGQAELKTSTANGSQFVAQGAAASYVLTGGTYSMWTASGGITTNNIGFGNADTAAGTIGIFTNDLGGGAIYIDERYFQASPPYDLGDGEIPLFTFLLIDNATGEIKGHCVAPEAPWHYNGKTNIIATRKDKASNRSFKNVKSITAELLDANKSIQQAVEDNIFSYKTIADRLIRDDLVEIELTQAIKQSDMNDIPHPFIGNNLTGRTIVMLDPVCSMNEELATLHHQGIKIRDLIDAKFITYGNSQINRVTPNGIMCVDFKWKNTL